MRIEKKEVIYITEKEMSNWLGFVRFLKLIKFETTDSNTKEVVSNIIDNLSILYNKIMVED